ncbi:MAG TPA: hypothetical protein VI541_05490 [Actinomycetota bacterium]|nr:hypothetical protein [Actinomycetota bacterium]
MSPRHTPRGPLRFLAVAAALGLIAVIFPSAGLATLTGLRAGAARLDSTWHVGASAGQYASDGVAVGDHGVDPFTHSTRRSPSYGIQGREWVRALVVEGSDGKRFAVASNDLYIPQDLLNRRVALILAEHDAKVRLGLEDGPVTRISAENLTISVSHSHSSPYYSTPSWGVWAFQDVFDIRFFEHLSQKMADAVIAATASLRPARVGGAVGPFSLLKRHSFGPQGANDGTPAGYPQTDIDPDLSLVRFDDVTDPQNPLPLANWVIFGLHPELLSGNDLLANEYVNRMETIIDREIGGVTLFSQNDTGTSEPARNRDAHTAAQRQEFSHREYGQVERAARTLASSVEALHADIATVSSNNPATYANNVVRFASDVPIRFKDLRFAPPSYRLLPTVSSCRTEKAFDGNPGVPIVGLPDCAFLWNETIDEDKAPGWDQLPQDPQVTYRTLRDAGVPIPDNVSAPSYTGLQETLQVHLQAIRIGDIGITVCPCEQWADQARNIKSRLNQTNGDFWYGWDWTSNYTQSGWTAGTNYANTVLGWCDPSGASWICKDPRSPSTNLAPISDYTLKRFKAQIYNDAKGWDALDYTTQSESEPTDISKIKGNYTHEELDGVMAGGGYPMVITVGMSNDYWGYIATYREFQRGDAYRKALTGLGPHSSDFLATRLSRMAAELKGGPKVRLTAKDLAYLPEYAHQGSRAEVIGQAAHNYVGAYEALLPADGGAPAIVTQPSNIKRFSAAKVSWVGGSNFTDTPHAKVERCALVACDAAIDTGWVPFGNGFGEVQVKANYPQPEDMPAFTAGQFEWRWDATFEAFDSDVPLPDASGTARTQTPAGQYRFVIDGCSRSPFPGAADTTCGSYDPGHRVQPYHLRSGSFTVLPWDGMTIPSISSEPGGISFTVGPAYPWAITASNTERGPIDYPNSYASLFKFIANRSASDVFYGGSEVFCLKCSFRPWADTGSVATAKVTVVRSGVPELVDATLGLDGRWHAAVTLAAGDEAYIAPGGIVDEFGEYNGSESAHVVG